MRPLRFTSSLVVLVAFLLGQTQIVLAAKTKVPTRQIPPPVIAELRLLERDFERALAHDCAAERCFSKGCTYLDHLTLDQPAEQSLPGFSQDPGPGSVPTQLFLTAAECSFAHEKSVRARHVRSLTNRLKAKLTSGLLRVEINAEKLDHLPDYLRDPPPTPQPSPTPTPTPSPTPAPTPTPELREWNDKEAARELWVSLLPHFSWMIAVLLLTFAALMIIWAIRRLGAPSPEEQALLAQMLAESGLPPDPDESVEDEEEDPGIKRAGVSEQYRDWQARLARTRGGETDPALRALVADLLRDGERRLLAKAVMLFPEEFPRAFPDGGALASSKFQLAEFVKRVDPGTLPADEVFFERLNRYALSSSLIAHPDTDLIRSLHDDFGAGALVDLLEQLPARYGALLFALSPPAMQAEAVGLMPIERVQDIADQLMRTNRIDPVENAYLLDVLGALGNNEALPAPPERRQVSDRGNEIDAAAALSVLLPRLDGATRTGLFDGLLSRRNGELPVWIKSTLFAEMLLHLPKETRADLLLEVDINGLASWLHTQNDAAAEAIYHDCPDALRVALSSIPSPESDEARGVLAVDGRQELSAALQRRLMRGDIAFESLMG